MPPEKEDPPAAHTPRNPEELATGKVGAKTPSAHPQKGYTGRWAPTSAAGLFVLHPEDEAPGVGSVAAADHGMLARGGGVAEHMRIDATARAITLPSSERSSRGVPSIPCLGHPPKSCGRIGTHLTQTGSDPPGTGMPVRDGSPRGAGAGACGRNVTLPRHLGLTHPERARPFGPMRCRRSAYPPGFQSGSSSPADALAARAAMKRRSDRRFR